MMNLKYIIPSLLLLIFFSGCVKRVDPCDHNNRSSVVVKSIQVEEKTEFHSSSKSVEVPARKSITESKKSELLKSKLRKCRINYIPWKDRLEKDLILMPKIINICSNLKGTTKRYILHSTKKKRTKGFILKNHVFIPYNWNSQQISGYLKKLKNRTVKKYYAISRKVKKQSAKKQYTKKQNNVNSVSYQKRVETTDYEVVEARKQLKILTTGNPYLYR